MALQESWRKAEGSLNSNSSGDIQKKKPGISFEEIQGLHRVKHIIKKFVILPILYPNFNSAKTSSRSQSNFGYQSVLLFGPPGVGKTLIAQAIAIELKVNFISATIYDFLSSDVNCPEVMIKQFFLRAQASQPCVVYLDHCDSLFEKKQANEDPGLTQMKSEFFIQLSALETQGASVSILFIAATSAPFFFDPENISRFRNRIYIPLPNVVDREAILKYLVNKTGLKHTLDSSGFINIARMTNRYSPRDLTNVVKMSLVMPLRRAGTCQYFRKVPGEKLIDGSVQPTRYIPTDKADPYGIKMNLIDVPPGCLSIYAPITEMDLKAAIRVTCCSRNEDWIQYQDFNEKFGTGGTSSSHQRHRRRPEPLTFCGILAACCIIFCR